MNYDHRFHAGNFADVFKHVVLTRLLVYLQRKPAPFRIIDTHAGGGIYSLVPEVPGRLAEWQSGVGRLDRTAFSEPARKLIRPYLEAISVDVRGDIGYPGSPALALRLSRPFDRMIFCELHPGTRADLRTCVARDRRAKVIAIDGYIGLNAFIPPVERRGLVLIDPPFEAADEFEKLAGALVAACGKWRDGTFMVWYPIKDRRGAEHLAARLAAAAIPGVLRLELDVGHPRVDGPLAASGLIVVNPPYTLEAEMACLLPELQGQLGDGDGAWRIDRLASG